MEIIKIDLVPSGVMPSCHASQYDIGREIRFLLTDGGEEYTLAGTETISIELRKPDGTSETIAIPNTSSNYVDWETSDGELDLSGVYLAEISIKNGDDVLGSANFIVKTEADAYDGADVRTVAVGPADICTFETTLPEPLQSVLVNVLATGGNGTPDNPNPINGYSSANITRCGVNLMHVNSRVSQTTAQVIYTSDDNYIEMNGTKYGGTYADLSALEITLPAGTYYLKAFEISGTATNAPSITAYNGSDLTANILNNEHTLTLSAPTTFRFRFALWTDNAVYTNYKIGIAISTASIREYSEYNGQTYAVAFGQTVYGGVPDVTRGKLTITRLYKVYDGSEAWYTSGASGGEYRVALAEVLDNVKYPTNGDEVLSCNCNMFVGKTANQTYARNQGISYQTGHGLRIYANDYNTNNITPWKTFLANTPLQVVYELSTPFDIDLTPEVISAIVGTNNVFADCGETTVKYLEVGA